MKRKPKRPCAIILLLLFCGVLGFSASQESMIKRVDTATGVVELPFGQARIYGNTETGICYVASNAEYKNKKWYRLTAGLASVVEQSAGVITVKYAVTGAAGTQITWATAYTVSAATGFNIGIATLNIANIPTTINGIASGDVYSSSGTLKIK